MKTIIAIFIVIASFSFTMQAQNNFIEKHMKAYLNDDHFTSMNFALSNLLSKEMLKEIQAELGKAEHKFAKLIKNLSKMTLLMTEKQPQQYYKETMALIKKNKYMPLMTVKEGKSGGMNILVREGKKGVEEVLMLAGGEDDFVLISFSNK
ncbi:MULTISPECIES: DUF4252 domain-containing protein [unclassified Aureispira]|uniref:DUF4252 domain-containing protein n=1 Tax=unclassified Aureispira TaxID=2649989 RepID=UPI0006988A61|nr:MULTISPECIES: DUF4252 domain-containing protein [unclassified Aureispira]WMX16851.1 DUF4252 domain-containing protein [Aureispira sp. CCB-E]